jgi:hypothetical protein
MGRNVISICKGKIRAERDERRIRQVRWDRKRRQPHKSVATIR